MKEMFKSAIHIIIMDNNKILLQKRKGSKLWPGYYALPAGHIDKGENQYEALIREAKEETGLDINELRLLGTTSGKNCFIEFPHGDKAFFITIGYVCKSYSGKLSIDNFETKDLRFFGYNELPENIPRSHKVFIEQYYNL